MDHPSMSNSIPVMRSPADLMNHGPNSDNLAAAAVQMHPIDRLQRVSATQDSLDLDAVRRLYGSALAMRLTTERQHARSVGGRLPGMDAAPDSNVLFETLTGNDTMIDFGDFLNTRDQRVTSSVLDAKGGVHAAMEAKLGL